MFPLPDLLLLSDGRFPAGSHATSAGAESAIRCGDISDVISLEHYLRGRLWTSGATDAAFAANACASVSGSEAALRRKLAVLDSEYTARTTAPRLRTISRQLGRQLSRSASTVWPHPALELASTWTEGCHQPIVLGLAAAAAGGSPTDAATIIVHQLSSAVTTAGVRMLGIDPLAAVAMQSRVARDLDEILDNSAHWARCAPTDLPANISTISEILAEDHGHWDARLFVV